MAFEYDDGDDYQHVEEYDDYYYGDDQDYYDRIRDEEDRQRDLED